jgi:hypothetical protein
MNADCLVDNVQGEALNSHDQIAAMTVCGNGEVSDDFSIKAVSVETGPDGSWFKLPTVEVGGRYRICWCAGGVMCRRGQEFSVDIGTLLVGGPDPSALYLCFEWEDCVINGVLGTFLRDGDIFRAVPPHEGCSGNSNSSTNGSTLPTVSGFPNFGLSNPATGKGKTYSWNSRIRAVPGVYDLCWCSIEFAAFGSCGETGPWHASGGSIRIGSPKEYNFLTRVKDPEQRSSDEMYALALGVILPSFLLCMICFGLKHMSYKSAHTNLATVYKKDPVAVNPFAMPKTSVQLDHDRRKLEWSIKATNTLRSLALGISFEQTVDPEQVTREGTPMGKVNFAKAYDKASRASRTLQAGAQPLPLGDGPPQQDQQFAMLENALPGHPTTMPQASALPPPSHQQQLTLPQPPQQEQLALPQPPQGLPPTMQRMSTLEYDEDSWKPPIPFTDLPMMAVNNAAVREILQIPPSKFSAAFDDMPHWRQAPKRKTTVFSQSNPELENKKPRQSRTSRMTPGDASFDESSSELQDEKSNKIGGRLSKLVRKSIGGSVPRG